MRKIGIANGFNACITALTIALSFQFIAPFYNILDSWKLLAGVWGVVALIICLLFYFWGKHLPNNTTAKSDQKRSNNLRKALNYRMIRTCILTITFIFPVYVSVNSYYPNYLHEVLSFDLTTAGSLTGAMSISGMLGGLLGGWIASRTTRIRSVVIVALTLMACVFFGMTNLQNYIGLMLCISFCGMSYTFINSFCITHIMRLPNITPYIASAGIALMNAFGSMISVFVPSVYQLLTAQLGLQFTMQILIVMFIPAVIGGSMLKKRVEQEQ